MYDSADGSPVDLKTSYKLGLRFFFKKTQKGLVRSARVDKVPPPTARLTAVKLSVPATTQGKLSGAAPEKSDHGFMKNPVFVPVCPKYFSDKTRYTK